MTEITLQFNPVSNDFAFMVGLVRMKEPGQMAFVSPMDPNNKIVWMKSGLVHALIMKNPECAARHPDNFSSKHNHEYFVQTYAGPSSPFGIPECSFRGSNFSHFDEETIQTWYYAGAHVIPLEMDQRSFAVLQELSRYNPDYAIERVYDAAHYPGMDRATKHVFESQYHFWPQTAAFVQHGPHERTTVDTEELVTQQTLALVDLDIACLGACIQRMTDEGQKTYGIPEETLKAALKCKDVAQAALPAYPILRDKGYVNVPEDACIPYHLHHVDPEDVRVEMSKWLEKVKALPPSTERADLYPRLAPE